VIPESKFIRKEITIRNMWLADEVRLTRKSLVRWVALSLGLISPKESRDLIVDLLDVLFGFFAKGESPSTQDILDKLKKKKGEEPNPKAVYYHLQKLMEQGLLKREKGRYYISKENPKLSSAVKGLYEKEVEEELAGIGKALEALEK
jgi:predicted transcriptional regulator